MLSKMAKFRLKNAKKSQLKDISAAVDVLVRYDLITIKRATAIDRLIELNMRRRG